MAVQTARQPSMNGVQAHRSMSMTDDDFKYTNAFKNRVWTWLRKQPKLTYTEYRNRSKDHQCEEWAFKDVQTDIILWGIWDEKLGCVVPKSPSNQERIASYNTPVVPPPVKELPPAPPSNANLIALPPAPEIKRRKLDAELKAVAQASIIAKPDITWEELQKELDWPEFTKTNYYAMREFLRASGDLPPLDEHATRGRKVSGDVALARQHLETLTRDELGLMNHKSYMEKFRHFSINNKNYYNAYKYVLKKFSIPRATKARKPSIDVAMATPMVATPNLALQPVKPLEYFDAVEVMAELDLSNIPQAHHLAVRDVFNDYFKKRMKSANTNGTIKVNVQMDPPLLEIRRAVKMVRS